MGLKGVTRGTKRPPRIVLYGPPKIGKSTFGSETPAPVFVTTEEGVDNLPVDQYPRAANWDALRANLAEIVNVKHEYQTLVLDTLSGAAELAAAFVCETQFKNDWGPKGFASFGQGWAATSEECRALVSLFDQARARGMTVLCLAHAGVVNVRNPIDGDYTKFAPDLDRRVWARFSAWADVILRADYEYTVMGGSKERPGRAVGASRRVLRCSGSAAEDAGCRVGYELPETMEMSWDALATAIGKESETLAEVKIKWGLLTKEEQTKTMAWLGVRDLTDAPAQKLRQILNRLRIKEVEHAA